MEVINYNEARKHWNLKPNTETVVVARKAIGLVGNAEKSKYMFMSHEQNVGHHYNNNNNMFMSHEQNVEHYYYYYLYLLHTGYSFVCPRDKPCP